MDKQYNYAIQVSANEASLEGRKAIWNLLMATDAGIVGVEAKVVENVFTPELKSGFELTFKNGRKLFAADDDWLFLMNGGVIAVSNNAVGRTLSDDENEGVWWRRRGMIAGGFKAGLEDGLDNHKGRCKRKGCH